MSLRTHLVFTLPVFLMCFGSNVAAQSSSFFPLSVIPLIVILMIAGLLTYRYYQNIQVKKQFYAQMGYASDADYLAARERAMIEGLPMPMIPSVEGQYQNNCNSIRLQAVNNGQAIFVGPGTSRGVAAQPEFCSPYYKPYATYPTNDGSPPFNYTSDGINYNSTYSPSAPPAYNSAPSENPLITNL